MRKSIRSWQGQQKGVMLSFFLSLIHTYLRDSENWQLFVLTGKSAAYLISKTILPKLLMSSISIIINQLLFS